MCAWRAGLFFPILLHDREDGSDVERIRWGKWELLLRGTEVVFEGERDDGEADRGFLLGSGLGGVQDEGAMLDVFELEGMIDREEVFRGRGLERKEKFEDDRVGIGLGEFVGLHHGLGADGKTGMEEVIFGEESRVSDAVNALDVAHDFRLVEAGNVVAFEVLVVGNQLIFVEGIEPVEEGLGACGGSLGRLEGSVGDDRLDPSKFAEDFVVPGTLGVVEEKKADAPAGDGKGAREEVSESPPEPGWTALDEFI